MTELDAILEDVRRHPADDLPRLALADWLMEQPDPAGQARGEFIHARCRAAALPPRDPERDRLQSRARELRRRFENDWLGDLAGRLEGWDFERGMILAWLSPGSLRRHPLARLTASAAWKWVIGLRATGLGVRELRGLFGSAQLAQLASLDLRDCEVNQAGARALAGSAHAARLASLDLGFTRLGVEGLQALAGGTSLAALRILNVCNNSIAAAGVQTLAASPGLPLLEVLDLSRNPVEDRGAAALAGAASQRGLRTLRLAGCGIRDRGGVALAASAHLGRLELIDLSDNPLGAATRGELHERFGSRLVLG